MYNITFFFYGLFAMLAQLVIFRELSVLFYGNELFLGTFLASWFSWVGFGSISVRRLLREEKLAMGCYSNGFLLLSVLLPVLILFIRLSKGLFYFGEFIGPLPMLLFTFGSISLLCFVIGAQFSLACVVTGDKKSALSRVYLLETLGAIAGGVIFTYLLIGFAPTFIIAFILALICVLVSLFLRFAGLSIRQKLLFPAALTLLTGYFLLEPAVNAFQWRRYQLIRQEEGRNSTLALVKLGSIYSVFDDGVIAASFPDAESYEPAAHLALLASDDPENILIFGDSSLGLLKEALKYQPKNVDYVVLDNAFQNLIYPYLDKEDRLALKDKRVSIHYTDPRIFIKKAENKYSAVIMNIPEVPNLKLNRFYTREFFNRIRSILRPEGLFALSAASSENYLTSQTRIFDASIYNTLKPVFKSIELIPGDNLMFICSPSAINMSKENILNRLLERNIPMVYLTPSYIEDKLGISRRSSLKRLLEETPEAAANLDFRPTTCYYFAGSWLNKFSSPLITVAQIALLGIMAFFAVRARKLSDFIRQRKEPSLIFFLGFIGILLELTLVLSFQIISGFVYWQIGALFASFMSGLLFGAYLGIRLKDAPRKEYPGWLIGLTLGIILLSIALSYILPLLVNLPVVFSIIIFLISLALIGIVIGGAFVIAGFLIGSDGIVSKSASLYAADLWGAAVGSILATNFIVPLFGIIGALTFSGLIGLLGLVIFLRR